MTRITEQQQVRNATLDIERNRTRLDGIRGELSSGLRVQYPGDDASVSGTISQLQAGLQRYDGHLARIESVKSFLGFQDNIMTQANNVLARGKELATQAANTTLGAAERQLLAAEVMQLRDQMVELANSKYQGRFVYGGADDDDPPYDPALYTNPASGPESQRFVFDAEAGTAVTKTVQVTDDLSMEVNTPGNQIFDSGIQALERLGRSLAGYQTTLAAGVPTGAGAAYVFPDEYALQTADIQATIDLFDTARKDDVSTEQSNVAGRLARLDTAKTLLDGLKLNVNEVLVEIQASDTVDAATRLNEAQTVFEGSLTANLRVLQLSILDYI